MNIHIDESGSFAPTEAPSSWSVVVGVASSEAARRQIESALAVLRRKVGALPRVEVKMDAVSEEQYLDFLQSINHPSLVLFAVATDAATQTVDQIKVHQKFHIDDLRTNIPRMKYPGGRDGLALLADQLERLSPQLYVQLFCQVSLLFDIISYATAYFAQNSPATLSSFRWRIDPKDKTRTNYELAFLKLAPALIQARSIRYPMTTYRGLNYRHMAAFEFTESTYPEHLHLDHGLPRMEGFDLQKILSKDMQFPDSKSSDGIQIADLLATGLMRLLRNRLKQPVQVARALGKLTIRPGTAGSPVNLLNFSESRMVRPETAVHLVAMGEFSRALLKARRA